jgi:hypothetical protein
MLDSDGFSENRQYNKYLCVIWILLVGVGLTLGWLSWGSVALNNETKDDPKGARHIFVNAQEKVEDRLANWQPRQIMNEIRRVVLLDVIKAVVSRYPTRIPPQKGERLAELLVEEGDRVGIDPLFLAAVIRIESAFSTEAISHVGARGLMQVMPATGEEVAAKIGIPWEGPDQLYDLEVNVRLGVYYLDWLLNRYRGSYVFALTAYNRGPTNLGIILRRDGVLKPQFKEYYQKIQSTYEAYIRHLARHRLVVLKTT